MSFLSTPFRPLARGGWGGKAASHWRAEPLLLTGVPWRGQAGNVIYRSNGSTQQFALIGVTRNSAGAALGGCVVALFRTLDDVLLAKQTSDASGNFRFDDPGAGPFYVVQYKPGSPDVAGTTRNTLYQQPKPADKFPLTVSANGRFLQQADGQPFFLHADYPSSIAVQCTHAQIDTYLNDRQVRGFNGILFAALEHLYSGQTPAWRNIQSAADPFTAMTDFATPNAAYWQTIDYIVNSAKARGMVCLIDPAYLGFSGTEEGWDTEVSAESDADLQGYGVFLAKRYKQGNVIWCVGGDRGGDSTLINKQWQIVNGIRSERTADLITGHPARTASDAYSVWGGFSGFSLNSIYTANDASDVYSEAATAYARALPYIFFEGSSDDGASDAVVRRQMIGAILSGACGHVLLVYPLWGFEDPVSSTGLGAAHALANYLGTNGPIQLGYLRDLVKSYRWWQIVPKTDASLVTSSLGTGAARVYPALIADNDGVNTQSVALIYTTVNVTVAMTNFTQGSVRGRWFDPITNSFAAAAGSPYANSGTQVFTAPGERVLVLD